MLIELVHSDFVGFELYKCLELTFLLFLKIFLDFVNFLLEISNIPACSTYVVVNSTD